MLVYYGYVYLHTGSFLIPIFRAQRAGLGVFAYLARTVVVMWYTSLFYTYCIKDAKGILTLPILHKTYNLSKNYCNGSCNVFYIDVSIFLLKFDHYYFISLIIIHTSMTAPCYVNYCCVH